MHVAVRGASVFHLVGKFRSLDSWIQIKKFLRISLIILDSYAIEYFVHTQWNSL